MPHVGHRRLDEAGVRQETVVVPLNIVVGSIGKGGAIIGAVNETSLSAAAWDDRKQIYS